MATSGSYNDLSDTPEFATVATSGSYNDLSNTPTIPDVSDFITKDVNNLTYYTTTTSLTSLLSNKEDINDEVEFQRF